MRKAQESGVIEKRVVSLIIIFAMILNVFESIVERGI